MLRATMFIGLAAFACMSLGARTSAEVAKEIKSKTSELNKQKKENPACYWNEDETAKMAMVQRMPTLEQKQHSTGKQTTYVLKAYWCAKTKTTHPVTSLGCNYCKNGFEKWKKNALLVEKTETMNKSIDALLEKIKNLNVELKEAQETERAAKKKAKK